MRIHRFVTLALATALVGLVGLVPAARSRPLDELPSERFQYIDTQPKGDQLRPMNPVFETAQQGTTYFGGTFWAADSGRWEAIQDSVWTFDTGVGSSYDFSNPDVNPFKNQLLHATMEGWIGFDVTYSELPYFRRMSTADFPGVPCVGSPAGLGGSYSFWAGVLPAEATALCYAGGQGYGDSWNVCIGHTFNYAGGAVTLEFDYVNDTEPGYDYTNVIVDSSGAGDDILVNSFDGTESGHFTASLTAGNELPVVPGPVKIKFCVSSDGAWSDQDGLNPTVCGAFAVDNIVLSGGIVHSADFETSDNGWSLLPADQGPGGEWSNIVDISDLPPPLTPCDCNLIDSVMVFDDQLAGGHNLFHDNLAASPWIDLKAAGLAGTPGKVVAYDVYAEMPLLNYVFAQTQIQWYPEVCPQNGELITSAWFSNGFVGFFGNVPFCTNPGGPVIYTDFSPIANIGAEQIRIAVGVINYCRFFPNCTGVNNSTPWYDNIRFGVFGDPNAPYLSTRTVDLPQDSFPENGTLSALAPGRIDSNNIKGAPTPEIGTSLGDTLVVIGGTGGAEVYVQFAVDAGPGVDPGGLAAFLGQVTFAETKDGQDWYYARMDTAEQAGAPVSSTYMTAFHEDDPAFSGSDTDLDPDDVDPLGGTNRLANDIFPDDLFTAGTRINLFYKTRYVGGTTWFTSPDTSGGVYLEMEVMPSSFAGDNTFNCVLYVDHFDGRGAQPFIESSLATVLGSGSANFENTPWDRYDVRAPDSQQGSFGRPLHTEYGASLIQTLGYKAILWNSGNLDASNLVKEDADILTPWLTLIDFGFNNLYLSGNGVAASMSREAASEPSARALLEDLAGALWACDTFRDQDCPTGTPENLTACIDLDPATGAVVSTRPLGTAPLAQGNGCPQLRSFDVLVPNATANFGTPVGEEVYSTSGSPAKLAEYASISNDAAGEGGAIYRTVVDGISPHYRRPAGDCVFAPATGNAVLEVDDRILEVMTYFGYTGGADPCSDPTAGTGVGNDRGGRETFRTGLSNFAPNPLVGGGVGRVQFTMSRQAKAVLEIFDVGGRLVRRVFDGIAEPGLNEVLWNGADTSGRPVASGVYFYRLQTEGEDYSKKLVVVRNGG